MKAHDVPTHHFLGDIGRHRRPDPRVRADGWDPVVFGHDLQNAYRQWAVKRTRAIASSRLWFPSPCALAPLPASGASIRGRGAEPNEGAHGEDLAPDSVFGCSIKPLYSRAADTSDDALSVGLRAALKALRRLVAHARPRLVPWPVPGPLRRRVLLGGRPEEEGRPPAAGRAHPQGGPLEERLGLRLALGGPGVLQLRRYPAGAPATVRL